MSSSLAGPSGRRLWIQRACAAVTGLMLGIGMGILVADGRWWPLIAMVPLCLALLAVVRVLVPVEDRGGVASVVALAFALHVAVGVLLYTGSLAIGLGGFIPGDDREYADVSANFVRYLKGQELRPGAGPPSWSGNAYLFGTWVYLESAIFFAIGPDVLVPILLNGTFALIAAILVFDMTRTLFDRKAARVALVLTAFYPTLVLWSSLNLKDALALLLISVCLWSLVRFERRPRWWALALAVGALLPMASLRQYLFLGLSALVPIVVAISPGLRLPHRAGWTAVAAISSALLVSTSQSGFGFGPQLLEAAEGTRHAMGIGARTRYVELPALPVKQGDTFVVVAPTTAAPTTAPAGVPPPSLVAAATPAVIHVAPNTRIIVATTSAPAPSSPGYVYVRPGDIVVVGPPGSTPEPPEARSPLTPQAYEDGVTVISAERAVSEVALRSIRFAPVGIAFSLFGPFPWLFDRPLDLLIVPEMLVWYACLGASALRIVRDRRRWAVLAPLILFVVGLLGLFALVEGNWGTLIRHRAMVVPWLLALASPTIASFIAARRSA